MKKGVIFVVFVLAIVVTLSIPPNVASRQKRALAPEVTLITKAEVVAQQKAVYDVKHQFQINHDYEELMAKLTWIAQNEAAR